MISIDRQPPAASSSGRTPNFGFGNSGSNPDVAPNQNGSYTHQWWCFNCGKTNHSAISRGTLVRQSILICDNCGCSAAAA